MNNLLLIYINKKIKTKIRYRFTLINSLFLRKLSQRESSPGKDKQGFFGVKFSKTKTTL